jgi:hypothetical protein
LFKVYRVVYKKHAIENFPVISAGHAFAKNNLGERSINVLIPGKKSPFMPLGKTLTKLQKYHITKNG